MGPCSAPARESGTYNGRHSRDMDRDSAGTRESSERQDGDGCVQPPSHPQRAPPPVPTQKLATGYLDALVAGDEYYTPEDDMASAPSSYRRLRRTRSMIPEFQAARRSQEGPGRFLASSSLKARTQTASTSRRFFRSDPNDRKSAHEAPVLRAPKSMSFLSSRKSQSRSGTDGDGGVQELRHSDLPDLPEDGSSGDEQRTPRPRYKASMLFSSRNRHSDLSLKMRKSLRSSGTTTASTDDAGEPSSNSQRDAEEPRTLRLKARHASRSLRGKLKSLFAMTKPDEETPSMPSQHISAQRTHITHLSTSTSNTEPPTPEDVETIHTPPARTATLRLVPPGLVPSRKASLESMTSGQQARNVSDGSSLTSWAHSGPSSLTSLEQQQWREWERQRLSVIGETGAHAPSASMNRLAVGKGVLREVEGPEGGGGPVGGGGVPRPAVVVDSRRIYSALVKRMRGADGVAAQVEGQAAVVEGERATPDTIKRVIPEWKYSRPADELATPTRASRRTSSPPGRDAWTDHHPETTHQSYQSRHNNTLTHERPASATTTPRKNRPTNSPLPHHLFRTTSPYRRALRKTMREEQDAWARGSDAGTTLIHRHHHHHRSSSIDDARESASTDGDSAKNLGFEEESVYSASGAASVSEYDDGEAGRNGRMGDTPAAYRNGGVGDRRGVSAASSVDWKRWLSANVGRLEPGLDSPSPSLSSQGKFTSGFYHHYPQRTTQSWGLNRHVREEAQICRSEWDRFGEDEEGDEDEVEEEVERVGRGTPCPPPMTTTTTTRVPPSPSTSPSKLPRLLQPMVLGQVQPNVPKRSPLRTTSSLSTAVTTMGTGGGVGYDGDKTGNGNGNRHGNHNRGRAVVDGRRVVTKMLGGGENESPSSGLGLSPSLSGGMPPPPIPARSKLRPEPLRIERGVAGSPGVGSPGLTEAVRRQFGGGGREAGGAFI